MAGPEHTQSHARRLLSAPAAALAAALEAIGTGAYVVDEQGRILAVNSRTERFLDRPAGDLLGHDAHDLLHRDAHGQPLPRTQCRMRQAFHAGCTAQAEEDYFAHADGTVRPISWLITPFDLGECERGTLVLFHGRQPQETDARPGQAATLLPDLERLALLAATTTQLTSTLDVDEALRRLVTLVVPRLADWVIVDLITERDEVWRAVVVEADGDALVPHEELQDRCRRSPRNPRCPCPGPCAESPRRWRARRPTRGRRIPASRSNSAACSTPPECTPRPSRPSAAPAPSSAP